MKTNTTCSLKASSPSWDQSAIFLPSKTGTLTVRSPGSFRMVVWMKPTTPGHPLYGLPKVSILQKMPIRTLNGVCSRRPQGRFPTGRWLSLNGSLHSTNRSASCSISQLTNSHDLFDTARSKIAPTIVTSKKTRRRPK